MERGALTKIFRNVVFTGLGLMMTAGIAFGKDAPKNDIPDLSDNVKVSDSLERTQIGGDDDFDENEHESQSRLATQEEVKRMTAELRHIHPDDGKTWLDFQGVNKGFHGDPDQILVDVRAVDGGEIMYSYEGFIDPADNSFSLERNIPYNPDDDDYDMDDPNSVDLEDIDSPYNTSPIGVDGKPLFETPEFIVHLNSGKNDYKDITELVNKAHKITDNDELHVNIYGKNPKTGTFFAIVMDGYTLKAEYEIDLDKSTAKEIPSLEDRMLETVGKTQTMNPKGMNP